MLGYLLRRVLAAIPVMGVVALFVFLLLRLTPGDPASILAGDNATPEQLERIRVSLGLHEPLYTQFFTWIGKLLHGDLGVSLISNVPVLKMIGQRVEPSISIALSTITLSILIAVPLGVIAAWKHGTWIDRFVMGLSVVGFSVPVFVIGDVLIQIFAIWTSPCRRRCSSCSMKSRPASASRCCSLPTICALRRKSATMSL